MPFRGNEIETERDQKKRGGEVGSKNEKGIESKIKI